MLGSLGIGGVMAVALIGVTVWGLRVDGLRAKHLASLHSVERQLKAESEAHDVTLESLSDCRAEMDETNAAVEARAGADAAREARYAKTIAAMQADAKQSDDRITRLLGMAQHASDTPSCPVDEVSLRELEGS